MAKAAKTLSVAQLLVLSTAAGRPDRMVLPLPMTLRARGASQQRLLASLLKLLLVEELPTEILVLSWRQDEPGKRYALQLTVAGLAAVAELARPPDAESIVGEAAVQDVAPEPAVLLAGPDLPAANTEVPRAVGGKLGKILAAVGAEKGATVDELVALTGWQKHTARAALTRLRQRGYPLQLIKQSDRKAYCFLREVRG